MMECSICNREIADAIFEVAGVKVPPLCERHMRWVNQALDNQKKNMEEQYGTDKEASPE